MKSTLNPRVRSLAVLALILLAGGGAYLLINGSGAASDTAGTQTTLQNTTSTQTTAKQNAKSKKSAISESRSKQPVEGVNALDAALATHPLVVVSVYAHNVVTDTQAMNEAKAGAAKAGAGFVAFNVYDEKVARQLAVLVPRTTSSPEVLFFEQRRKLVFTLLGFADSQVVAQAAVNIFPHTEPWVSDANTICGRFSAPLATAQAEIQSADLTTAVGRNQAAAALDKAATLLTKETNSLRAVRPTVSDAADYAQFVVDLRKIAINMRAEAVALRRNDQETAKAIDQKNAALIVSASGLAASLQLTTCAS